MKNMKLVYKVRTNMVNDFVLKAMEWKAACLDIYDFTYALLCGMMERVVFDHDMSEIELNYMKIIRRGKNNDCTMPHFKEIEEEPLLKPSFSG